MNFNFISAVEAAHVIKNGDIVGLSGFTPAGSPKAVMAEVAKMAEEKHAKGEEFQIGLITGASTAIRVTGRLHAPMPLSFALLIQLTQISAKR